MTCTSSTKSNIATGVRFQRNSAVFAGNTVNFVCSGFDFIPSDSTTNFYEFYYKINGALAYYSPVTAIK
jgi:hypothetical protein